MNESQSKVRGLALDLVEEGKDLSLWETRRVQKKKKPLPEGVTNGIDVLGCYPNCLAFHGRAFADSAGVYGGFNDGGSWVPGLLPPLG